MRGRSLVGGEVVGQLAVPVGEHRPQRDRRHRRVDAIDHPGRLGADFFEVVRVSPAHGKARRQRGQTGSAEFVDETSRGIEVLRPMLGHPAQTARQR